MQHILLNLSEMLVGAGALIVTIAICLFLKGCGVIVEDHEQGEVMSLKSRVKFFGWCIALFAVEFWAIYYHTTHQ